LQNRLIFFNLLPGTNRSFATQERGHGASNQWGSRVARDSGETQNGERRSRRTRWGLTSGGGRRQRPVFEGQPRRTVGGGAAMQQGQRRAGFAGARAGATSGPASPFIGGLAHLPEAWRPWVSWSCPPWTPASDWAHMGSTRAHWLGRTRWVGPSGSAR
jgi:hypothetical protein